MKRLMLAAAALVLTATACTASRVDPKADIAISGSVRRQGGVPVARARLALTREGDAGDVLLAVTTMGLACIDRAEAPAICRDARLATAGSNGGFTYQIKGKDTQSTFGYSAVLSVSTALGRKENESSGSSTTYRFHVQTEKLNIPIRLWEPVLAARTGSFGARASFPRVPSALVPVKTSRALNYTVAFTRGSEVVWRLNNAQPTTVFDPRLLEDTTGAMRVIASASNVHVSETLGDQVAFAMRSGARPYESPLGPPASRGSGCSVVDEHGKRYPVAPCLLTDGTFAKEFTPIVCNGATGCVEPRHEGAFIDLGRRISASFVVVRGCRGTCRVETSLDARTWRLTGVAQSDAAAFSLTRSVPARYVRVSASPIDGLTEVSVWSGTPRVPEGSLLVAPQTFRPGPAASATAIASEPSRSKEHHFNVWALVAATLLGGVLGALVAMLRRKRAA